jgi:translation initiation factor IF-2
MKPQTIESINHAKEAKTPIIVAVNKMDKQGVNLDMIRTQMSEQGLQPEDWGGDVVMVPVSAHTGMGIENLLEMILLSAEMLELKANPNRAAVATVIESHLDTKQ